MIGHPTSTARHALEEAFCRDVDNLLIGRMQIRAESDEAKARLVKATGWKDQKLISQMAALGVTPNGLMAIQMIPLVLIAWANHGVDSKERDFVMSKAKRFGIRERSEAYALLEHWLSQRPPVMVFDTWRRFIRNELASMCPKTGARLVALTKEQMQAVARCSGGFWGFRRICHNEHKLITSMSRILDDCLNKADSSRRAG